MFLPARRSYNCQLASWPAQRPCLSGSSLSKQCTICLPVNQLPSISPNALIAPPAPGPAVPQLARRNLGGAVIVIAQGAGSNRAVHGRFLDATLGDQIVLRQLRL